MASEKKKRHTTEVQTQKAEKHQPQKEKVTPLRENISESIAEDIFEAIEENRPTHKGEEAHSKKLSKSVKNPDLKSVIIVVTFAILLYWGLQHFSTLTGGLKAVIGLLSPFIIGFAIAFIINTVLVPLEKFWRKLFGKTHGKAAKLCEKLRRPVCLVLATIIVIGFIFAIFFMIVPELKNTFVTLADKLPSFIERLQAWWSELSKFLANYNITLPEIKFDTEKILDFANSFITSKGQAVIDKTLGITTSIFSAVFNIVLAFVFAFYVLGQKEKLGRKVRKILYATMKEKNADTVVKVATLSNSTFAKFVTGQLAEAFVIGVLCFVGMLIFRMPYATVISVLVGATALIPMFGAFIGTALGAILILSVNFMTAVWFVVFIIVLQQLETNLIYPRVVGKQIGLPGILVLASVTIGGGLFGFAGILLGVPVCSVLYSVFNEFVAMRLEDKGKKIQKKTE